MRIAVLSDTHVRNGKSLPNFLWEELEKFDLILHAGDLVSEDFLTDLKSLAPVEAVRGNCDWGIDLPEKRIIHCKEGIRLGLTHGAYGVGQTTPERAYNTFVKDDVDIIVFGHSHQPYKEWHNGVLLFNPGSPTDKRREPKYSYGIIEIEGSKFDATHVFF